MVLKKPNDQSHVRALMLQGVMLTNFFIDFLLSLALMFNLDFLKYKLALIFVLILNFIVAKLENRYYIDTNKYNLAIVKYENRYTQLQKRLLGILALLLFLFSTIIFIWIGIKIGKQVRPY